MSEGISSRAFDDAGKPKRPANARICKECNNLTTFHHDCPLCGLATLPHPEAKIETGFCVECAEEFPAAELTVIPWEQDPYLQTDDGDLITICPVCQKCRDREEDR